MKTYLTKTPKLIKELFPNYIWDLNNGENVLYLTFDDGPHPKITPWVLNMLAEFNAKASFFCIGENIIKYREIQEEIKYRNHVIGNHTFNHLNGWKTKTNVYLENVKKTDLVIKNTKGLFRPPHGKIKTKQAKYLLKNDYRIIMWDILSGDFDRNLSKEQCLQNVIQNTQKGSIIVFHDSEKAFDKLQYVLPKALEYFTKKGFVFKVV
ncbi:MAG: polysaccharide deacetylase family protein [Bacteroidota bacterium]